MGVLVSRLALGFRKEGCFFQSQLPMVPLIVCAWRMAAKTERKASESFVWHTMCTHDEQADPRREDKALLSLASKECK